MQIQLLSRFKITLKSAYLLAKIGTDTADNERNFAQNWLSVPLSNSEEYEREPRRDGSRGDKK